MENYSALKKKRKLSFATWENLQGIVLNQTSQTEKTNFAKYHLYVKLKKKLNSERKSRKVIARSGWEEGG